MAELSYAYVHAVAASAGVECVVSGRISDNEGVDLRLFGNGPFPDGVKRRFAQLDVQIKATSGKPAHVDGAFSYSLRDVSKYDLYRCRTRTPPCILVALFLPESRAEWVAQDICALSLRRCAYWLSLRGAPETSNATSVTIRFPTDQVFDAAALKTLMRLAASDEFPFYKECKQ
ncbi:DUF4365 domain-containing protein [Pararobbsia alpina]|uniref:DUF4365 domain-containing protein n=1 Tax=Pararobbsia alpina TaxID=621374 RepID=UPI0039A53FC0